MAALFPSSLPARRFLQLELAARSTADVFNGRRSDFSVRVLQDIRKPRTIYEASDSLCWEDGSEFFFGLCVRGFS